MKFREIDTMRIDIITVLPEMLEGFVHESILHVPRRRDWLRYICTICATTPRTNGAAWTTIPTAVLPAW